MKLPEIIRIEEDMTVYKTKFWFTEYGCLTISYRSGGFYYRDGFRVHSIPSNILLSILAYKGYGVINKPRIIGYIMEYLNKKVYWES